MTPQLDALATEPLLATLATVLGSGSHLFEDFLRLNPVHMLPVLEAVVSFMDEGVIADFREPCIIRMAPVPLYNSFEDVHVFGEVMRGLLA